MSPSEQCISEGEDHVSIIFQFLEHRGTQEMSAQISG